MEQCPASNLCWQYLDILDTPSPSKTVRGVHACLELPNDRQHSLQFHLCRQPVGTGSGGLAPNVQHVCPSSHHLPRSCHHCFHAGQLPSIAEAVGRHIQNSHDLTPPLSPQNTQVWVCACSAWTNVETEPFFYHAFQGTSGLYYRAVPDTDSNTAKHMY